jgi:hypothetical protein
MIFRRIAYLSAVVGRHVRVDLVARCGYCIHRRILNGVSLLAQSTQEQRDNFA